ncbi:TetR/AcrR family transcriptional regulator [Pedococcus sp. NPDC057267]|uniref:TetR/AcrR family transcriptional regulator n=1 Tax=Pedococcus sp. NPDC057267 TaxID=3346077 RepID=UPI0036297363
MPRRGLTRELVAGVAAEVADEMGFDALTLSAVAQRLGVSQPALYKHVPGIDALRRDVAVQAVEELVLAIGDARQYRRGRAALEAVAVAYREYAARHPGRVAASVRAPALGDDEHASAGARAVGVLAGVLEDYGIAGTDTVHAVRAVRATLHGFVVLEAAGGFGLPESVDESFDRLLAGLDLALSRHVAKPS